MKEEGNSADIFLLIKGLSSSEKSYYKKMSKRHSNQNSALHLMLFNLIEESGVRDENKLCKALGIENKIHFSGIKTYLCNDILTTLIFQKRNDSIDTRLSFMLDEIRILKEKGLLYLADKVCKKAMQLASKYEKYHFLVLSMHHYLLVSEFKDYKKFKRSEGLIFSNLHDTINEHRSFEKNRYLYQKVKSLTNRSWLPISETELTGIHKAKEYIGKIKPAPEKHPLISLFYLNTLALCEYMLHDQQSCAKTCREVYDLWSASPHLINEYPALFINSVNTNCYNDFLGENILMVRESMSVYSILMEKHLRKEYYRKHFEIIEFNTELKVGLKTAQYEPVKKMIDQKAEPLFSYVSQILSPADQLSILSSVCIAYFVLQQWEDAERLLAQIKEQNQVINREDILYFSMLFHLAILYEEKEWIRLDNALETAYHLLYSRKKLRPFENELILFLKHLNGAVNSAMANTLTRNFLTQLDKYRDSPDTKLYFLYFNYYGWLESKLMGIAYKDYVSEKVSGLSIHKESKD